MTTTHYTRYGAQPALPVVSARDAAEAIASGEVFMHRAGMASARNPLAEDLANDRVSLLRMLMRAAGQPENDLPANLYNRMMGMPDLHVLAVAGMAVPLITRYTAIVEQIHKIAPVVNVPTFHPATFQSLGVASPQPLTEHADIPIGSVTMASAIETIGVESNGLRLLFSRQAIVNDLIEMLVACQASLAVVFGAHYRSGLAAALESTETLLDGAQFFHAGAGNLVTDGANPSVATLDTVSQMMAQQTLPGGQMCGLLPRYILVPPALFATASTLIAAVFKDAGTTPVDVLVLPELSGDYWYAIADPALAPTLATLRLSGSRSELRVERDMTPISQDGIAFAATSEFAIARLARTGIIKHAVGA